MCLSWPICHHRRDSVGHSCSCCRAAFSLHSVAESVATIATSIVTVIGLCGDTVIIKYSTTSGGARIFFLGGGRGARSLSPPLSLSLPFLLPFLSPPLPFPSLPLLFPSFSFPSRPVARIVKTRRQTGRAPPALPFPALPSLPLPLEVGPLKSS